MNKKLAELLSSNLEKSVSEPTTDKGWTGKPALPAELKK